MENCCDSMMKVLLFLLNLFTFICGILVVVFASIMYTDLNSYQLFFGDENFSAAIALIIVGVFIIIISFLGCCGAITENSCMMYSFGILMIIILITEIGVAIAVVVFKDDVKDSLNKNFDEFLPKYKDNEDVKKVWDAVQKEFECCGSSNYTSWKNIDLKNRVPDSCCIKDEKDCGRDISFENPEEAKKTIYTQGCFDKFMSNFKDIASVAGGIGIAFGIFQLVILSVSFCLARKMKN